jgi:hypothetical protein
VGWSGFPLVSLPFLLSFSLSFLLFSVSETLPATGLAGWKINGVLIEPVSTLHKALS